MNIVADLHLHSKFSRAVSKNMVTMEMSRQADRKGIDLLATGDWFHPAWMSQLQADFKEWSEGIYVCKEQGARNKEQDLTKFLLSGEISNIYQQGGQTRRVHTIICSPSIKSCLKINEKLRKRGCNLSSDGRPIIGLSLIELSELVFSVDEKCMMIPAHAWTPWFALYGSKSGFDSIEEAFGKYSDRIFAIETGLSSDPVMNWRIKELEKRNILSFSDAHSPAKMGREATVFQTVSSKLQRPNYKQNSNSKKQNTKFTYGDIYGAIAERFTGKNEGNLEISHTIEFYPEEGKYHWDGHRKCKVIHSPEDTRKKGIECSVCGKPLTVGVEFRVDQLADKQLLDLYGLKKKNDNDVVGYFHPSDKTRPHYVMMVPLLEILAEVEGKGVGTKTVKSKYDSLIDKFESEFKVLLEVEVDELKIFGGERLSKAIDRVRKGDIVIDPGYDGVFGTVKIWPSDAEVMESKVDGKQMGLF